MRKDEKCLTIKFTSKEFNNINQQSIRYEEKKEHTKLVGDQVQMPTWQMKKLAHRGKGLKKRTIFGVENSGEMRST